MATSKKTGKGKAAETGAQQARPRAAPRSGGKTPAPTASRKPGTPKPSPGPTAADASYYVRGFVVHLGDDLPPARRRAALQTLAEQVPQLRHAIDERALARAKPLGKGCADVLIPLARSMSLGVREAWNVVHALRRHALVADAEPAVRIASGIAPPATAPRRATAFLFGDDTPLPQAGSADWSVVNARIRKLWATTEGTGILVGHPDTGYTHHAQIDTTRLLAASGYDFEDDRDDPLDPMTGSFPGHGTGTASVIMSNNDPAPGVFGAAPDVRLIPYRVSDSVIHFDFTNLTQALYRARDQSCDLISMSLGGPWAGRSLARAVDDLIANDIVLLAAAGNIWPFVVYPAKFDNVVACAASNALDQPWSGSASGDEVDISAPGESVWRAFSHIDDEVLRFDVDQSSGTSYAVATAAGACALWFARHGAANLRAQFPGRVAAVFMNLLKTSGFRSVPDWKTDRYGPGILDATALLGARLPAQAPALVSRIAQPIATSQRSYAWARLQPFFPELGPDELARAIVPAFGRKSTNATRRLADVIDEVEFFVATNPRVRESIIVAARSARVGRSARGLVAPPDAGAVLRAVGSGQLRSKLA